MKALQLREPQTDKPRWGRRVTASAVASLALMLGYSSLPMSSASASASTAASSWVQILYPIDVVRACQEQGHLGALAWNTGPYGWFCYDPSTSPPFWNFAGGVDIQGYCNRHYPGTRAIIYYNNLYGWRCSKWVNF
jgi:hypothetical protein